jgi:hypothetical protein
MVSRSSVAAPRNSFARRSFSCSRLTKLSITVFIEASIALFSGPLIYHSMFVRKSNLRQKICWQTSANFLANIAIFCELISES